MADIYATNDSQVLKNIPATSGGSWDACRDATSGQVFGGSDASTPNGYGRIRIFQYSGVTRWIIHRVYMEFDTSGITTLPTDATLKIHGYSANNSDLLVVKGTQSDSLVADDYDNLDVDPGSSAQVESGGYFSEADSDKRPYIDVTETAPAVVTFNEFKIKNSNLNIKNSNLKINIK